MTDKAMSPLRRRMLEDMTIRRFGQKTQHDYVRSVKDFAKFIGRSPDTAKPFQLHLTSSGAGVSKINQTGVALRFFFNVTLNRPDLAKQLSYIYEPRKIPVVLSPEEVARFLEAAPGIKYKAAFSVAYGAGLRVSEVASLKDSDIDSKRMMLLDLLRDWYRVARPQGWRFPGKDPINPITARQLNHACHTAAEIAEIKKRVTPHTP
jgi:integrase